ncbi:NINE protein [Alteribacter aurantiacus]|uniref:NINE protein n=1 Tax=Alteribacter aurantiacus TaxID=254410 RepID=UPI00040161E3|nr:TM2 domain-containing protein [Alteribacter aurantiacus]
MYLLWFFLGELGGHSFYLGDTSYAIGMVVVWVARWFLFFIPIAIWALIDVFLIVKRLETLNEELEQSIIQSVRSYEG